jgi:hypothetical protein
MRLIADLPDYIVSFNTWSSWLQQRPEKTNNPATRFACRNVLTNLGARSLMKANGAPIFSTMIMTDDNGRRRIEAFRRSRTCFHRFDCAIARRRVDHKRFEQMLCSLSDIIDSAIESCLVCLGRFGETAQLPDELKRRCANFIVCSGWTEVVKCFDGSAHEIIYRGLRR